MGGARCIVRFGGGGSIECALQNQFWRDQTGLCPFPVTKMTVMTGREETRGENIS